MVYDIKEKGPFSIDETSCIITFKVIFMSVYKFFSYQFLRSLAKNRIMLGRLTPKNRVREDFKVSYLKPLYESSKNINIIYFRSSFFFLFRL